MFSMWQRGGSADRGAVSIVEPECVSLTQTGTLTAGTPRLVQVVALDGLGERELLRACASAESFSEHPIARSVVRAAGERGLAFGDPESFTALPGLGVRAVTAGRSLLIGRPKLMRDEGLRVEDDLVRRIDALSSGGRTVIIVANAPAEVSRAGQPIGLLVFEDAPRPEAQPALAALRRAGIRTVLITGDNRATAERVAAALGIDEVHAEASPPGKVEIVRRLQSKGMRVAFVGDGVNDAPSLAAADVGIAMGLGGTDVAIETAEIALLSDDLSRLPHLVLLSRRAVRTIRQNLAFSLGVLGLAVGLTTIGLLTPVTGALLHELSSLPVIANSARLIGRRDRD
jgi:Cd2+/Zn2+-exporting ATPase